MAVADYKTTLTLSPSSSSWPKVTFWVPFVSSRSTGTQKESKSTLKTGQLKLSKSSSSLFPVLQHRFYHCPLFQSRSWQHELTGSTHVSPTLSETSTTATAQNSQTTSSLFTALTPMAHGPLLSSSSFWSSMHKVFSNLFALYFLPHFIKSCLDQALFFSSQILGRIH